MKKNLLVVLAVLLVLFVSVNGLAAKRHVFIDPAHGGLNYGFEIDGQLEKNMNLRMGLVIAENLQNVTMYRTGDKDNFDGTLKTEFVNKLNPEVILGIHHHGKYAAFIEYNKSGARLAYQLAAYFASEDIPYKLVRYKGVWLFDQPQPAIVLIVNEEIEQIMNLAFIAKILEGLE